MHESGSTAVHLATSAAPGAAALRRQLAGRFRGAALLDPWLFPNDDEDYPPHHGDDRAPPAASGTGKREQKAGAAAAATTHDETISARRATADPSASFLCLHGVWNWPANVASEGRFVASMPRSRVAHARHASAGHHNYSDISFLAPPAMAAMGMVAWRDPVQVRTERSERREVRGFWLLAGALTTSTCRVPPSSVVVGAPRDRARGVCVPRRHRQRQQQR